MIVFIAYFIFMIGIGVFFFLRSKSGGEKGYFLGGRKMGPWVAALSAQASDMSGWLLMGLPGAIYMAGIGESWVAIGLAIGTWVNWLIVAKRLRTYTVKCDNSTTIPVFFSNRYRDDKKILSVLAALVIIIFFVPYTASGFAACGKLFSTLFGMDYFVAMVISANIKECMIFPIIPPYTGGIILYKTITALFLSYSNT